MIEIKDKKDCCGCTACKSICPKKCITMEADIEGFLYPTVNLKECISCGACERTCPIIKQRLKRQDTEIQAYCLRSKDKEILENSTSGGFFSSLCDYVLDKNGIVVGAVYADDKTIKHIIIDNESRSLAYKFRGSKYVQSYLGDIFSIIKQKLQEGTIVCFSGTPCQVSGLLSFLGKEYDNLITLDVVCHGTPSPKLWEKYIDYQENKYGSAVSEVSFRKKTYGYHSGTMELVFENGKKYHGSARVDFMLKSFFSEISSRPSCYMCNFKSSHHDSNFTIFDSWHAEKLVGSFKDDDRGYTNVFVNNRRAEELFECIKDKYEFYNIDAEEAIKADGKMVRGCALPHKNRGKFYKDLDVTPLNEHIQRFIPISAKDYFVEFGKGVVYKLGLLNLMKKIIKQ